MKPIVHRLFIAVPIHNNLRPILSDWCEVIKDRLPFQKWVHSSDYHITLKYLGEADFKQTQQVKQAVKQVTMDFDSITLSLEKVGTFGKGDSPSILWAGVNGQLDALQQLQKDIEEILIPLGYQPDARAYNPHVTLARKFIGQQPFDPIELETIIQPKEGILLWNVKEVVLYQSNLGRSPMYQPLTVFPLMES